MGVVTTLVIFRSETTRGACQNSRIRKTRITIGGVNLDFTPPIVIIKYMYSYCLCVRFCVFLKK